MYRNAIESMKEKSIVLSRKKQEIERESAKMMTFTPRINSSGYSRLTKHSLMQAPEDSLLERYCQQRKSLEKKKAEKEMEVKKECPFKPIVSEKSSQMAKRARSCRGKSKESEAENDEELGETGNKTCIFEILYNETKGASTKSLLAPKLCTFHPAISNWSYTSKREYISQPVSQRLLNSKKAKEEQMKKIRERKMFVESNFDPNTGQKLHRPVVSRGPKKAQRENPKTIFESLYKETYLKGKKQKAEETAKLRSNDLKSKNYSITNSIQLLEKGKKTKCDEIFKLLDPDTCGKISKNHIHLDCKFPAIP